MNKNKLKALKERILALGLSGIILVTTGCISSENENKEPKRISIDKEYSSIEENYKYIDENGNEIKVYNSQNVYLLFDYETYEVKEYIFKSPTSWIGGSELYDLVTEEMLAYGNGISNAYNEEYFEYLKANNYKVCLTEISTYVKGHISKEYYSLEEIKSLEPLIIENLKQINANKLKLSK